MCAGGVYAEFIVEFPKLSEHSDRKPDHDVILAHGELRRGMVEIHDHRSVVLETRGPVAWLAPATQLKRPRISPR
jgi:hypothetical protein